MRRETRQYICAELLNYQRSRNEMYRIREKLDDLRLFPAYSKDYTAERKLYLQDRLFFLQRITEAISIMSRECSPEEKKVLELKFWSPSPRPTDNEIAHKLGMSTRTLYRNINSICRRVGMLMGTDI